MSGARAIPIPGLPSWSTVLSNGKAKRKKGRHQQVRDSFHLLFAFTRLFLAFVLTARTSTPSGGPSTALQRT